jgi:hypothetical protein
MSGAAGEILNIDRSLVQVSAVTAIAVEGTQLFVREKVAASLIARAHGDVPEDKAVLIIYGDSWPSVVAFDPYYPVPDDERFRQSRARTPGPADTGLCNISVTLARVYGDA